jgi:hypothetical protein
MKKFLIAAVGMTAFILAGVPPAANAGKDPKPPSMPAPGAGKKK